MPENNRLSFYMAPMEGITGYVFRNALNNHFPGMAKFYSPFVSPGSGDSGIKKRDMRDILPENNREIPLVPQILCNRAADFLNAAALFKDLGYREINLNLGCPSGTVVSKHKGSGFLSEREALRIFFEEVFSHLPSGIALSVKTRIGRFHPDEFPEILSLFNNFPIAELIVHPRIQKEFYRGEVHMDAFRYAVSHTKIPLCYNGDLWTKEDIRRVGKRFPDVHAVMLGRGVLRDPFLGVCTEAKQEETFMRNKLIAFHNELVSGYQRAFDSENATLCHMKEFWSYLKDGFTSCEREWKKIKKSSALSEYMLYASLILKNAPLCDREVYNR